MACGPGAEGASDHSHALDHEEHAHHTPRPPPRCPPLVLVRPRRPAHQREEHKDDRVQAHQCAIKLGRAEACLQWWEDDELEEDSEDSAEGQRLADLRFAEGEATERG